MKRSVAALLVTAFATGCSDPGGQSGRYATGTTILYVGSDRGFEDGYVILMVNGNRLNYRGTVIEPKIPLIGIVLTFDPENLTTDSYSVQNGVVSDKYRTTFFVSHKSEVAKIKWDRSSDTITWQGKEWEFKPGMIFHVHEARDRAVTVKLLKTDRSGLNDADHIKEIVLDLRRKLAKPNRVPATD